MKLDIIERTFNGLFIEKNINKFLDNIKPKLNPSLDVPVWERIDKNFRNSKKIEENLSESKFVRISAINGMCPYFVNVLLHDNLNISSMDTLFNIIINNLNYLKYSRKELKNIIPSIVETLPSKLIIHDYIIIKPKNERVANPINNIKFKVNKNLLKKELLKEFNLDR